jgi:chorismate synthase
LIEHFGMEIHSHVIQIGSIKVQPASLQEIIDRAPQSELFCADPEAEALMKQEIDQAREQGDSLGGIFEIIVCHVPVAWQPRSLGPQVGRRLAAALMSIQAIKGVEIGLGFTAATLPCSQVHDENFCRQRRIYPQFQSCRRLEAGMTNGQIWCCGLP